MSNIPFVDFRFSDRWLITDFVNPHLDWSSQFEGDDLVEEVATFIRDQFIYPMMGGTPSSDGQLKRFHKSFLSYTWARCVFYMWSFPNEVLTQKVGICIDTANLATSLLIAKAPALVCLGEVRKTHDDTLLGLHAWTKVPYKGELNIMETTIHEMGINTLVKITSAYNKDSDWVKAGGVYYVEQGTFNDKSFEGNAGIVAKMGLPASRVLLFGLEHTCTMSRKKLYKEWRNEDKIKEILLQKAFGAKEWRR